MIKQPELLRFDWCYDQTPLVLTELYNTAAYLLLFSLRMHCIFPPILIQSLVFISLPLLYSAENGVCFIWLTSHSANSHKHQSTLTRWESFRAGNGKQPSPAIAIPARELCSLSRLGILCKLIEEWNVITAWLKCFLKYYTWHFNPLLLAWLLKRNWFILVTFSDWTTLPPNSNTKRHKLLAGNLTKENKMVEKTQLSLLFSLRKDSAYWIAEFQLYF